MENSTNNYLQQWGNEIAAHVRRAWNGTLPAADFGQLFSPSMVFHFHARDLHGSAAYQEFISTARAHTAGLDLEEEMVLTHGDKVVLYFCWTSSKWHPDVVGADTHSNYCKVVLRVADGRIAEVWQQTPDFIYLLGKQPVERPMEYPVVVQESILERRADGIFASEDAETLSMGKLFMRMNDCAMNRASLREMKELQNEDMVFSTGGIEGNGVQAWKTFAYALHTSLGSRPGIRFDEVYVREGARLRVFLRATQGEPTPYMLQSADGQVAGLEIEVQGGRISLVKTRLENYLYFLGADLTDHDRRLRDLFRGVREPIPQTGLGTPVMPAASSMPAAAPVRQDDVAIVGIAGRFPKCASVDEFWQALDAGHSLISSIPAERAYLSEGTRIGHAGFIDDVGAFDPAFFQMLPAEAQFIDPQQRLLLQEIVHSMEDSGHPAAAYAGARTGLFIANLSEDYQKLLHERGLINHPHTWAGNENAMFPSRVARYFNIQGPCHFINTECTSSLVALHEASRQIRAGEIDQAIVGATSLLLHSYGFSVRTGTLLTEEPQARLFSKDSNGQLRGEAIVSVVLKSLTKAREDGDHIYGLVAGSAVNNSGKTLSLAAGNVERQAAAITDAWQAAGVKADDVSVIECHASGVRGGDFAEIAALKRAFGSAERSVPVRLSTAKAAIGHAEAASGMVSLVKLLLQFKHGRVAGIHGFDAADPELGLDPARFALDQGSMPLMRPAGSQAPLVAGINAFAAGGYNAHVVIREYTGQKAPAARVAPLIMLSAQSEASLTALAQALRTYLERHPATDLGELAASLRRRDTMKYRAAFVPASVAELVGQLGALADGQPLPPNAFSGRRDKRAGPTLDGKGEPLALAAQWAAGQNINWNEKEQGRRLDDLPLYPFEAKRYWLPDGSAAAPAVAAQTDAAASLHPLVHRNVSSLSSQRYQTTFTGAEPLLADHVVMGRLVLPGVAYLEMVRAAVADALQDDSAVQLRNVVWLQPIMIDPRQPQALDVSLELTPLAQPAGSPLRLAFEVSTMVDGQTRLHCQGQVDTGMADSVKPGMFDAAASACTHAVADAAQVYAAYAALGISYGPAYRALRTLHSNGAEGAARQVLATLALPDGVAGEGYRLHPSLMDGALHSAIGLAINGEAAAAYKQPPLPFALERLQVHGATTGAMSAWIRHSAASESGARVQKLDIDLFDQDGKLCVAMSGFASRTGERDARPAAQDVAQPEAHAPAAGDMTAPVLAHLRQEVARILQVVESDVDPDEELSEYGFDSINLTELGNRLNDQYRLPVERPLNPTIFFEYPTLGAFARFLAASYRDEAVALHGAPEGAAPSAAVATAPQPQQAKARFAVPAPAAAAPRAPAAGIAIVGVSGRFPLANDVHAFWGNLAAGRDCISEIPAERWDWRAKMGNPHTHPHKTDVKWGGFIDGISEFDSLFFGISPREAELMDPQQRLLMQHAWQAIEDAGYSAQSLSGTRTGVFLATAASGYAGLITEAGNAVDGSTITGAVPSVAPNRISFLLNLHGPSEPIETACSSSLVAIHRAMVAIETGTCDMAIVGGVNTIVTPDGHIGFRKAGMLCEDGRCKTFSRHANGYVRGEGVGVLLLKKLADAELGRDHIYAVIRGSSENHGGRATSLTAPNPNAQADLIKAAFTQAGVDPRHVGYMEAHGTGTELGDPIEVNGLKIAFSDLYQKAGAKVEQAHCGLGSVKSNIGHLELAAGIAGVIKVLQQFKHKTLVKSLHSEEINPYVQLHGSPFYIVQENRPWLAPLDADGRELPRLAGVSAFGFGGANAHVVLEEYVPVAAPQEAAGPVAIVLSARTAKQLRQAAQQLLDAVGEGTGFADNDLAAIAYTLQVGRDPMEHRLGFVAESLEDLRARLRAVLEAGTEPVGGVYQGAVKPNREALAIFHADEDLKGAVNAWLAAGKFQRVLQMWVKGLMLDWEQLYASRATPPARVSLPGYPFARERHWVPQAAAVQQHDGAPVMHPLAQRNTSDFSSQRYSSTFDGREFFLRDHVVLGRPVLPAVAYLEMVRAAVADAAKTGPAGIVLRNVVWTQPVVIESGKQASVHVALKPAANGDITFQVSTQDAKRGTLVHCEGIASTAAASTAETLDLARLEQAHAGARFASADVYAGFKTLGIEYGSAHQCVRELSTGIDAAGQVQLLATLELPPPQVTGLADYVMHPGLLDGALQAGIGFMLHAGQQGDGRPPLPFHLKQLDILAPCTPSMRAWLRRAPEAAVAGGQPAGQTIDIDLCDDSGRVCVRLRGFASRAAGGGGVAAAAPKSLVLAPVWEEVAGTITPAPAGERVLAVAPEGIAAALRQQWPEATVGTDFSAIDQEKWDHIVWIAPDEAPVEIDADALLAQQEQGVYAVFGAIKSLLAAGCGARALSFTVLTTQAQGVRDEDTVNAAHAGVAGLAGTLTAEYPLWKVRSIDLAQGWSGQGGEAALVRHAISLPAGSLALRDGVCHQRKLAPLHVLDRVAAPRLRTSSYKEGGVYAVIGGAGGIGEAWTEYMILTYKAQVVWIGRSAPDAALEAKIARLAALGPAPVYLQADCASLAPLQQARAEIRRRFGRIDGLVNSALVLADQSLARMTEQSFRAAYAAKADLSVRMAQAFEGEVLDFVLFFSSLVAFGRPPGQANYVAGCVFKDTFARQLGARWNCAVKVMNWGYWGSIGVGASEPYRKRMAQMGIGSIETAEGMDALEMLLGDSADQTALVKVTRPLAELARGIYSGFLAGGASLPPDVQAAVAPTPAAPALSAADSASLEQTVCDTVAGILSDALKVDVSDIDIDEAFTGYGLDSITGVQLAQTLNQRFALELDVTAFFDYGTVRLLAGHLMARHGEAMARALRPAAPVATLEPVPAPVDSAELEEAVCTTVAGILSDALKVDISDIDIDEAFTGYGLDSITGVQLAQTLNQRFGMELDVTAFFDYGTVRLLAGHLLARHGDAMAQALRPAPVAAPMVAATITQDYAHVIPDPEPAAPAPAPALATGIAIVGMSGAFPMAEGPEQLWSNLVEGKNCVTEVPAERWDWKQVKADPGGPSRPECFRWGGFVDGVDQFDADFFGITPEEAMYMSPQQRLLLTHAWKAVEDAGIAPRTLAQEATGVFIASVPSEYLNTIDACRDVPLVVTGLSTSMIPNRISHSLNLHGPSEHYDTACSSTLVALHRAVQAIRNGECRQALVGAVNLLLTPAGHIGFEAMGYLTPGGQMTPFGPEASGFVRAEGVGVVLLKPLEQAVADGDQIYGVIRGSGVAHGGSGMSMTTPNGAGMRSAMRQAYESSGVDPATVSYVEAHGIGSVMGDTIEISALKSEYERLSGGVVEEPCWIGSARPCVGYAEVASGMVSLFKVLMAMRHATLPGIPGFAGVHQNISLKNSRFQMVAAHQPWEQARDASGALVPRRAAINNYGFSGVNGHLILEEYVPAARTEAAPRAELVVLSGRSPARLRANVQALLAALEQNPALSLADVAFTLQTGRDAMNARLAVVTDERSALVQALRHYLDPSQAPGSAAVHTGKAGKQTASAKAAAVQLARDGELDQLARQWVRGAVVPWELLPAAGQRRRVSLPGQVLEPQRCWVEGATGIGALHGQREITRSEVDEVDESTAQAE